MPLKVKVMKIRKIDTAQYSPLGNADQFMAEILPADRLVLSHDKASWVMVLHSPPDAEQPRVQGSTEQNFTQEHRSNTNVGTTFVRS